MRRTAIRCVGLLLLCTLGAACAGPLVKPDAFDPAVLGQMPLPGSGSKKATALRHAPGAPTNSPELNMPGVGWKSEKKAISP